MKAVFKNLKDCYYVDVGLDLFCIVPGTVFWLSKQICHPIRKVLERNVKPCKGNNNEHMQSCCAKIFKTINSHNARNDPMNCHVSVTILQMRKHVSLYRGRGFLSVCKDRY